MATAIVTTARTKLIAHDWLVFRTFAAAPVYLATVPAKSIHRATIPVKALNNVVFSAVILPRASLMQYLGQLHCQTFALRRKFQSTALDRITLQSKLAAKTCFATLGKSEVIHTKPAEDKVFISASRAFKKLQSFNRRNDAAEAAAKALNVTTHSTSCFVKRVFFHLLTTRQHFSVGHTITCAFGHEIMWAYPPTEA
jgi:hypothetical protein